jgi:hypothetical protein
MMPDELPPWVACASLRDAYWDAIRECARLQGEPESHPADPTLPERLAAAESQRVAARDALQDFKNQQCERCQKCAYR